jgi:hypothetical protein
MPKKGISVTLGDENLVWLRGRTVAMKGRSLSETLDDLVTTARTSGNVPVSAMRSVAGTVDIATDDPHLEQADAYVQRIVTGSLARPFLVRDAMPAPGQGKPGTGKPSRGSRDRRG